MNKLQIINEVKNIVNDTDDDEQINSIIETAINHCYIFELSKVDKLLKTSYVPIINGLGKLPEDCLKVEKYSPSLIEGEKRVGNNLLSDRGTMFSILYIASREPMINDTDEPEINQALHYSLVLYGAMSYFNYRKKLDMSNWYKNLYDESLFKYQEEMVDNEEECVGDIYG